MRRRLKFKFEISTHITRSEPFTYSATMLRLARELNDKPAAIRYLQNRNILHNERDCDNGHRMELKLSDREDRWRCGRRDCRQQKQLKSGTWLEGSHLSYSSAILFIYCWSKEYTTVKFCEDELNIRHCAVVDWNNYLREICAQALLAQPVRIGGPNLTVEIDESLFVRRKHNVGHQVREQWVFGGICRETRESFLYTVEDRSAATLIPIITDAVLPGTKIISDQWAAYNGIVNIPNRNFLHETVNHAQNFVDPVSGACTNKIECLWNIAKSRNRRRWGTHRSMIDSYMCEFMWRQRHRNTDLFDRILLDIAQCYPL